MPIRRALSTFGLVVVASIAVIAQADKFEGEFKVDRGKVKQVKRIALVDVVGETKNAMADHLQTWTIEAQRHMVESWQKAGFEVVSGPEIVAAFNSIVPIPTADEIKRVARKKNRGWTDAQIEQTAQTIVKLWGDEPGEAAKLGYKIVRADGTVNLERPLISEKDPSGDRPDEDELAKRAALLRQKLGVDAIVRIDYGFGSWRYEEPGYVKGNRAMGKSPGLIDSFKSLRGFASGAKAAAMLNIEMFSADGKKLLIDVMGACNSKDGTGMSLKGVADKVEAMMPATTSGCIDNIFKRLADD